MLRYLRDLRPDIKFSENEETKSATAIMAQYGLSWQFSAILLVGMATFLPKTFALDSSNFQRAKFDYIDVAKETTSGRSKGHTTRIFTTADELDEEFWLKYLGEDFHRAVHLQVDDNNNVIPQENKKSQHQQILYDTRDEQRTRFVRQSLPNGKQLPSSLLRMENRNQYRTENLQEFKPNLNSNSLSGAKHEHMLNIPASHKFSKLKSKLQLSEPYKQKRFKGKTNHALKAIHEPIVVNLPENGSAEQQVNGQHVPIVFQLPPVIYHRKANLYRENLSNSHTFPHDNNLYTDDTQNMEIYPEDIPMTQRIYNEHHHNPYQLPSLFLANPNLELYSDQIQST